MALYAINEFIDSIQFYTLIIYFTDIICEVYG